MCCTTPGSWLYASSMRKELSWIGASSWAPAGSPARSTAAANGRRIFIIQRPNFGYPKLYLQRAGVVKLISDPVGAFLSALPRRRPSPPLPLLSPRERRETKEAFWVFLPSLPRGERGRGREGRRRGDPETTGNSRIGDSTAVTRPPPAATSPTRKRSSGKSTAGSPGYGGPCCA